jgi:hypothetical protein
VKPGDLVQASDFAYVFSHYGFDASSSLVGRLCPVPKGTAMLVVAADDPHVPMTDALPRAKVYVLGPGFSGWAWSNTLDKV